MHFVIDKAMKDSVTGRTSEVVRYPCRTRRQGRGCPLLLDSWTPHVRVDQATHRRDHIALASSVGEGACCKKEKVCMRNEALTGRERKSYMMLMSSEAYKTSVHR